MVVNYLAIARLVYFTSVTFHYLLLEKRACYNISLLFLNSQTKGLCVSASISNISGSSVAPTQLSVRLLVDNINMRYFQTCGTVESSLPNKSHEFNCTINLNELSEVEFVISSGDIDKEWTTKVRVSIEHDCTHSKGTVSSYLAM